MRWFSTNLLVGVLVVVVAALSGYSFAACRIGGLKADYITVYALDVVNDAPELVRIRIDVGGQEFKDIATGVRNPYGSGIITLRSREKREFEMSVFGPMDSPEDNYSVTSFGSIAFFEENHDAPYKRYEYWRVSYDSLPRGCAEFPPAPDCSDDAWLFERRPEGTEERLFVESPDRPFYLERDKEDPDLARIVITFVPEAGVVPVVAGN